MRSQRVRPEQPGPGQESVWDYPRPPRVEPTGELVEVQFGGSPIVAEQGNMGGGWVVNQNAPQQAVLSPGGADGNQDLLL